MFTFLTFPTRALLSAMFKSHFLNPKQIVKFQVFGALLFNARKWQPVLAMDDRYLNSAFMYVSFNMPFFVVYAIFANYARFLQKISIV